MTAELTEKRRRVHGLLTSLDLDAVVLRSPGNVAWYTGGGRTHVLVAQDVGVADLVVTRDGEHLVVHRNEVDRILAEEMGDLDPQVTVVGWGDDRVPALPGGPRVGFDLPPADERDVATDIEALRRSLTEWEVDRYRDLGRQSASVFTDVLSGIAPTATERDAAAQIGHRLLELGADPMVLLVAGESRVHRHRHPLPTEAPIGALAMVVACARRGGLIAALTRHVSFGGLSPELDDAYERLLHVEQAFLGATRPGADVAAVYRAGVAAYGSCGFPVDEADRHHQGGPIGYFARDYLATPSTDVAVETSQAFAWNPSVASLKVEDTVLTGSGTTDQERIQVLTADDRWPAVTVSGVRRPLVLER